MKEKLLFLQLNYLMFQSNLKMEDAIIILIIAVLIIGGIGYLIGQSNYNCDKDPGAVEYWKNKYIEEQKKNELLTNQILDVLINSYTKKLVWSVSGLTPYKIVCYTDYSNLEIPEELKNLLDNICSKPKL